MADRAAVGGPSGSTGKTLELPKGTEVGHRRLANVAPERMSLDAGRGGIDLHNGRITHIYVCR
jgi:hypothetical protein